MQPANTLITPIDFWTTALATSTAALAASAAITQAALQPWQAAQVDDGLARRTGDGDGFLRPAPAEKVRHLKSWYRAPYRSPFDPMFWMSPGHPGDHLPLWMGANWMNFWAQAANPLTRYSGLTSQAGPATQGGGWAAPWTPWRADTHDFGAWPATWPLALIATQMMQGGKDAIASASNVVDFPSAFSTYRSAGGHAVAQVTRSETAPSPGVGAPSPLTMPIDLWTAWMRPWLPR